MNDIYTAPFLTYWPTSFSFKEAFQSMKEKRSVGIKKNPKLKREAPKNLFDFLFMGL